jgi:hypothetical protein
MNNTVVACVAAFAASMTLASVADAALVVGSSASFSTQGPPTNILSRTQTSILNPDAEPVTVQIEVSDTNFTPAVSDIFTAASGSFVDATGSTITLNWYIDRTNAIFGKTELIDSFSFTVPDAAESFSHNFSVDLLNDISSLYSMTLQMNLTLVGGGGALNNLSQSEQGPELQGQVPEPTALALLGIGLAVLALSSRKRAA